MQKVKVYFGFPNKINPEKFYKKKEVITPPFRYTYLK